MASANSIKVSGQTVEWDIADAVTIEAATGNIYWYSTASGSANASGDTESYWNVNRIICIPPAGATTGGYVRLYDNGDTTAATVLAQFNFSEVTGAEVDVLTMDLNGHRCRPVYASTLSVNVTTNTRVIFHLA